MDDVMKNIMVEVMNEYDRAARRYGPYHHSEHESFGVMFEEFEEANEDFGAMAQAIQEFWIEVKKDIKDPVKLNTLDVVKSRAVACICELIQVAAMAHKAALTIQIRQEVPSSGYTQ